MKKIIVLFIISIVSSCAMFEPTQRINPNDPKGTNHQAVMK